MKNFMFITAILLFSTQGVYANNPPVLSWTGEVNYETDGLDPETGFPNMTTFIYRVKYTDIDNDAPDLTYPRVHIKKGGVPISGSPFTMTYVSGNYNTGAIYTYSRQLSALGTDYTYSFEARDVYGAIATGEPTIEKDAPDVLPGDFILQWSSPEGDNTRSIAFGDYDNDGDLDQLVGNFNQQNRIYRNNGDGTWTLVWSSPESDITWSIAFGDYDNDGDLDQLVGNRGQPNRIYNSLVADNGNPNTAPFAPTSGFSASYNPATHRIQFRWDYGSDTQTPQKGLYYTIRIGTTTPINDTNATVVSWRPATPFLGNYPHGFAVHSANPQPGFNYKPPLQDTTYYWQVRSIDAGLQASPWSAEQVYAPPIFILEDPKAVPLRFALHQNHPNPFNSITNLKFDIPVPGFVSLKVFNILGREVATLVNEKKPAGRYEIQWNARNLPSGIYFYRLQSGTFIDTKKLLLLRDRT